MCRRIMAVGAAVLTFLGLSAVSLVADWVEGGTPICKEPMSQGAPRIAADGKGGLYMAWADQRWKSPVPERLEYSVCAQRMDAQGNALWSPEGVLISNQSSSMYVMVTSDGRSGNGAVITWLSWVEGCGWGLRAQRVDDDGVAMWPGNGVVVSRPRLDGYRPLSDGDGGIIVVYPNSEGTFEIVDGELVFHPGEEHGLRAQWIKKDGSFQWGSNGVLVNAVPDGNIVLTSDGDGGVIVAWSHVWRPTSLQSVYEGDIYCQRIAIDGTVRWGAKPVPVCTAVGLQHLHQIVSDGDGGAIIAWEDHRTEHTGDIRVQRIDASGTPVWTLDGIKAHSSSPELMCREYVAVVSDGSGGAVLAWEEVVFNGMDNTLYAQRVDGNGNLMWGESGVTVCDAAHMHHEINIIADGDGGAIMEWLDRRACNTNRYGWGDPDIYAQKLDGTGAPVWMENGVRIASTELAMARSNTSSAGGVPSPVIATDGDGGALIAWNNGIVDTTTGLTGDSDVLVAKINSAGEVVISADEHTKPSDGAALVAPGTLEIYPNPFNPSTRVRFAVGRPARVTLSVFDPAGRLVRTLALGLKLRGQHEVTWDGTDNRGKAVASGVYFCRLAIGTESITKRLVLVR